jgi:transcriptional regulator
MRNPKNDLLQGTLSLLVLKTLARGPMHGYGITLHIQMVSKDILRVEEGSLYPALHRMEQEGLVSAEWGNTENNRRARYYRLTSAGRKQLAEEEQNWMRLTQAVAHVLEFAGMARKRGAPCPGSRACEACLNKIV